MISVAVTNVSSYDHHQSMIDNMHACIAADDDEDVFERSLSVHVH